MEIEEKLALIKEIKENGHVVETCRKSSPFCLILESKKDEEAINIIDEYRSRGITITRMLHLLGIPESTYYRKCGLAHLLFRPVHGYSAGKERALRGK